jgi:hypothetical protein
MTTDIDSAQSRSAVDARSIQILVNELPKWACVAFAARAARTAQKYWVDRRCELDLTCAVNIAEQLARDGGSGTDHRAAMARLASRQAKQLALEMCADDATEMAAEAGDETARAQVLGGQILWAAASAASSAAEAACHAANADLLRTRAEQAQQELGCRAAGGSVNAWDEIGVSNQLHELSRALENVALCAQDTLAFTLEAAYRAGDEHERLRELLLRDAHHLNLIARRKQWTEHDAVHLNTLAYDPCFLSYAVADEEFASLLHQQLTTAGVTCWKWNRSARPGRRLWDEIEAGVRSAGKLVLIASTASLQSKAVQREVALALGQDETLRRGVLIPVLLDPGLFEGDGASMPEIERLMCVDALGWRDAQRMTRIIDSILLALRGAPSPAGPDELTLMCSDGVKLRLEPPPGPSPDEWLRRVLGD